MLVTQPSTTLLPEKTEGGGTNTTGYQTQLSVTRHGRRVKGRQGTYCQLLRRLLESQFSYVCLGYLSALKASILQNMSPVSRRRWIVVWQLCRFVAVASVGTPVGTPHTRTPNSSNVGNTLPPLRRNGAKWLPAGRRLNLAGHKLRP